MPCETALRELIYILMKALGIFVSGQAYLIPQFAPTTFLRKSRPLHKSVLIVFPNHMHIYLFNTYHSFTYVPIVDEMPFQE